MAYILSIYNGDQKITEVDGSNKKITLKTKDTIVDDNIIINLEYRSSPLRFSKYITFISEEDNNIISFNEVVNESPILETEANDDQNWENEHWTIYYRTNFNLGWLPYTFGTQIQLNSGEKIDFVGENNENILCNVNRWHEFTMTGKFNCRGDVYSLINQDDITTDFCFFHLFNNCTHLLNCPDLFVLNLSSNCYHFMFKDCSSIVIPTELPATALAEGCYHGLFYRCTSLQYPPVLPATELQNECYWEMFSGCYSLKYCPELPALTMKSKCYRAMFSRCLSISIPAELPATELAENCYAYMYYGSGVIKTVVLPAEEVPIEGYQSMFANCPSLIDASSKINAKVLMDRACYRMFRAENSSLSVLEIGPEINAERVSSESCYEMFIHCTSLVELSGSFASILGPGCYREMFYDCSSLITVPDRLPAKTLEVNCYRSMFNRCTSLTKIPKLSAMTLAESCY